MGEKAAIGGIICCIVVMGIFVVGIAASMIIAELVIGFREQDNVCTNPDTIEFIDIGNGTLVPRQLDVYSIGLAKWLIFDGILTSVLIVIAIIMITILLILFGKEKTGTAVTILIVYMIVVAVFNIGWLIYGILIVANSKDCKDTASSLYNLGLAVVILKALGTCGQCGSSYQNFKSKKYDTI